MRSNIGILSSSRSADAFDPLAVAGLEFWIDANDAASFTFSSGAVVSQWNDKSGNARHITPVSSGPTRVSAAINGKAAVDFTPPNMHLKNATAVTIIQPYTIFTVAANDTYNTANTGRVITNRADSNIAVTHGDSGSGSGQTLSFMGGTAQRYATASKITDTAQHQGTVLASGALTELRIDGVSNVPASPGTAQLSLVTIGGRFDGTIQQFDGKICEVLVYNGLLTSTYYLAIEAYLKAKWGTP